MPRRRRVLRRRSGARGLWLRGRCAWWTSAFLLAVLSPLFALVGASPASAHGGFLVASGTDGPYNITVRARPLVSDGRDVVDLTAYVVGQRLGEPDLTAQLTIRLLEGDGAPRTLTPSVVTGGYEVLVPVSDRESWRTWRIEAIAQGADGTSRVTGGPAAREPGAPAWLPWASGAALLVVLGGVWWLRRRRAASSVAGVGDRDDADAWPEPVD